MVLALAALAAATGRLRGQGGARSPTCVHDATHRQKEKKRQKTLYQLFFHVDKALVVRGECALHIPPIGDRKKVAVLHDLGEDEERGARALSELLDNNRG